MKKASASNKATPQIIDFSNVKDRGAYNPKHIEPGEYTATVTKVEQTATKSDGEPMWVFTIVLDEVPRATYPYYCKLVDNQYWKVKTLFQAAGVNVGQRKVKVDPNKLIGKQIGVGMEDDEYEGRLKSVIVDVFPPEDLHDGDVEPEEDDLEEDEVEEEPAPRKKSKKRPEPEPEEDEEEDDLEDDEEEPEPPRRAKKAPAKKTSAKRRRPAEDDEDEDEDELEIDEL